MIEESDSSSENDNNEIIPREMMEVVENMTLNLLPQKSKMNYTRVYNAFKQWRKEMETNSFDEIVLLNYFDMLAKKFSPNSLWATYSKLKMTIKCYDHMDISNYKKLQTYLKRQSTGYQSKKSKVFTKENIVRFLSNAPDEIYLAVKVALIMGISGALRRSEFVDLLISDCLQGEDMILVNVRLTKNKVPRSFTVMGELYQICKKYMNTRPEKCETNKFFLKYANDKCTCQPIGINKFGAMPKQIALFLNLADADMFTGHSFRRTSATLLVDAGADITALKRHGGWKSNTVAGGYIADSLNNKKQVFKKITSGITINNDATNTAKTDSDIVVVRIEPTIIQPTSSIHDEVQPDSLRPSTSSAYNEVRLVSPRPSTSSAHLEARAISPQTSTSSAQHKFRSISPPPTTIADHEAQSLHTFVSSSHKVDKHKAAKRNLPHDSITETPSTTDMKISNKNTIATGDSILQNTKTQINEKDSKLVVFYDPDLGLFSYDTINVYPINKTIIIENCNVTLHGTLNDNFVFKNCNIRKSENSTV